jgi:arsenate reductase
MAEGIVKHYYGDRFDAHSAGARTAPVHPLAIKVMAEIGIDISKQRSKSIEEFFSLDFDYVITLCGEDTKDVCPVFPGKAKQRLNWNFFDPAEAKGEEKEVLEVFRKVRDEIKIKIDEFVNRLER